MIRRRRLEERLFKGLMVASLALIGLVFAALVGVILVRGAAALSWETLVQTPRGGYYLGGGGGIANAIVGSLYLGLGGLLLSLAWSIPVAFGLQKEFIGKRWARVTRLTLDVLWGTPSIVLGAIAFVVMPLVGLRTSLLSGILVLSVLMLPIMTRAMEEVIRMVPRELKETALAMGSTRLETVLAVTWRQALPGLVTGVLLAFGRGIGDAASILFATGYTDRIPSSLLDPVASLPLAVFFQIQTPIPAVQERAYAAAVVLMVIILLISLISRWAGARLSRHRIR